MPSCTASDQPPPGLEQEPPCSASSGLPPLPIPKTPPLSKRSLSPQRVAAAARSRDGSLASGGTGNELPQIPSRKRLEASPAQRAKEAQSCNQWAAPLDATTACSNLRSHRGFGFLELVSAWPPLKPVPAFPEARRADSPRLGRTTSVPNLPVQEEADADPGPLLTNWMICRCCAHTSHADDDFA